MKLHRALRSDWSEITPQQRNIWQRCAARSHGTITPANIVSIIGAALTIRGLVYLFNDQLTTGLIFIIIGRCADILDGIVAEYTKTKSPLGEAIDASIDKTLIIAAVITLFIKHLLPVLIITIMIIQAVYNSGVSVVAKGLNAQLHPSRTGKLSAVFEWSTVGLYLLAHIIHTSRHATIIRSLGVICFCLFVILALISSINYTRNIYYKRGAA